MHGRVLVDRSDGVSCAGRGEGSTRSGGTFVVRPQHGIYRHGAGVRAGDWIDCLSDSGEIPTPTRLLSMGAGTFGRSIGEFRENGRLDRRVREEHRDGERPQAIGRIGNCGGDDGRPPGVEPGRVDV